MQNKYCLPIQKTSKQDILDTIHTHANEYAFFEVWLDYVESFDLAFLNQLVEQLHGKLVIVFRHKNLEPIVMPLDKRLAVLDRLSDTPVLVDLDQASQATELKYVQDNNLQLNTVVSHHDYTKTPTNAELESLVNSMLSWKPTVLKIAAMCQTEMDAVRLLGLQLNLKARGQRHIILGMGEHGVITRVFGTLWGNELIFVPDAQNEASAPGQLTRQQLNDITKALKG